MSEGKGQADWKSKFKRRKVSKPRFWSSGWSALEVAKLIVGILTPTLIAFYGEQLKADQANVHEAQTKYAQVIKKRVELWGAISRDLNDIYCYFLFVGRWKDFSPSAIIQKKRNVDSIVYANRPFFSDDFVDLYEKFMRAAFNMNREWGKDAQLKTKKIRPGDEGSDPSNFTEEDNSKEIFVQYYSLLKFAATELDASIPKADVKGKPKIPQSKEEIYP